MTPVSPAPFFSIIIPAHNEEHGIATTCEAIIHRFDQDKIQDYEILVVDDHSTDNTQAELIALADRYQVLRFVCNDTMTGGFGHAIRKGLEHYRGSCVAIVMGDLSDHPDDIVAYYHGMKDGAECMFGSRFIKGSRIVDYPRHKLVLNRLANWFIRVLFRFRHNDITNAFKCYRRNVIDGVQPLLSRHFNLTVEIPLKAIIRGYSFRSIPISWHNRTTGVSKLKIKEMGSRYLFIVLYCWLERKLAGRDYYRKGR